MTRPSEQINAATAAVRAEAAAAGCEPLTDAQLAAMAPLHREQQNFNGEGYCVGCGFHWPCHEARLIAEVRRLRHHVAAADHHIQVVEDEVGRLRALVEEAYWEDTGLEVWYVPAHAGLVARVREAFDA